MKARSIKVDGRVYAQLERLCEQECRSFNDQIRYMMRDHVTDSRTVTSPIVKETKSEASQDPRDKLQLKRKNSSAYLHMMHAAKIAMTGVDITADNVAYSIRAAGSTGNSFMTDVRTAKTQLYALAYSGFLVAKGRRYPARYLMASKGVGAMSDVYPMDKLANVVAITPPPLKDQIAA